MKKNLKKESKTVWNFKKQYKLPTKKEEQNFIDNLRLDQREYTVFDCKDPKELWNNGDWEGLHYDSWFKVKIRYVLKLINKQYLEYFD